MFTQSAMAQLLTSCAHGKREMTSHEQSMLSRLPGIPASWSRELHPDDNEETQLPTVEDYRPPMNQPEAATGDGVQASVQENQTNTPRMMQRAPAEEACTQREPTATPKKQATPAEVRASGNTAESEHPEAV